RLLRRGALRRRFRSIDLYVIITRELCRWDWLRTAEAALRGGAGCLQLREKACSDGELLDAARRLRELTGAHGALFVVNDRADIAALARADGVHVGQDDLSVADARRAAGANLFIGKSTHNDEQFQAALAEQPDYIAIGPMFATATKPQPHIAGVDTLRRVAGHTDLPLVGIGGITAERCGEVIQAGASCVCVCSAVIGAADPEAAARELRGAIARCKPDMRKGIEPGSTHE
ncbi:MAG: thiamine phosphate synthase, partial [Phycisphaerales bacterium]|nr:thiamine phosphate synthase [Phycisphaerales bacterium]